MMSRTDSVHGEDYLIDYYALLGVARDAALEKIKSEYRKLVKQYHADRFQGLAPELLEHAKRRLELFNEAFAVLADEAARRAYDVKLAGWEGPVSTHGEVVIDLTKPHFSFSSLLAELGNEDQETREHTADKLALEFSGFEKATYDFFCTQAASPDGLPAELKDAYREQLKRRDFYLSIREGLVWDSLGQKNHAPTPRLEYREQVSDTLDAVRQRAHQHVADQVMMLAAGERQLLEAPAGMESSVDSEKVLTHYTVRIDEHFAEQEKLLGTLAKERQEILGARFDAEAKVAFHPGTVAHTDKLLVEIKKDELKPVWLAFEFDGNNVNGVTPPGLKKLNDPDGVKKWMDRGYTIMSFEPAQGIDFMSQLEHVLGQYAERLETADTNE